MTEFTRVTVVGSTRKADLVVPNDESIGTLIPQLMDLLDEATSSVARPLTLVRSTGEQLDLSLSAAQQLVRDGELLRLLRIEDAPPPPEVSDVTDVVADSLADRVGLWSARYRMTMGAVAIGVLAVIVGFNVAAIAADLALLVGLLGWAALVLAAVLFGRYGLRWASIASTAAALGVSVVLGPLVTIAIDRSDASNVVGIGFSLLFAWAATGLGSGLGLRLRPITLGAIVGVLSTLLPILLLLLGVPDLGAFGITAVALVAAVGLIPWYAMSASGLTGLDDQIVEGGKRKRDEVLLSVTSAYRTMTWAAAGLAIPLVVSGSQLLSTDNGWSIGLGIATVLVIVLRTRAFPLASQSVILWTAALVPTVIGILDRFGSRPELSLLAAIIAAIVVCVLVGASPANHQRARLRRFGNLLEALSVIALLPLLLGIFDVYADLLGTF